MPLSVNGVDGNQESQSDYEKTGHCVCNGCVAVVATCLYGLERRERDTRVYSGLGLARACGVHGHGTVYVDRFNGLPEDIQEGHFAA